MAHQRTFRSLTHPKHCTTTERFLFPEKASEFTKSNLPIPVKWWRCRWCWWWYFICGISPWIRAGIGIRKSKKFPGNKHVFQNWRWNFPLTLITWAAPHWNCSIWARKVLPATNSFEIKLKQWSKEPKDTRPHWTWTAPDKQNAQCAVITGSRNGLLHTKI